ncbi:MAG: membrane dipeptidase [Candidatus Uhrbacteria bacterium]
MDNRERQSSLHCDVRVPLQDGARSRGRDSAEYNVYPKRFPDAGEHGERSVIRRLAQFGVDLEAIGLPDVRDISEAQYESLLGQAVRAQFDIIFANAFDHLAQTSGSEQWRVIEETARMVTGWQEPFGIGMIRRGSDVGDGHEPSALVSLEGLHVFEGIEQVGTDEITVAVERLHRIGIRSVTLQYGTETRLATINDGLTVLGEEAVRQLLKKGILVDLAHALPKTRTDIFRLAEDLGRGQQVVYTHGAPSLEIAKDPGFAAAAEKRGLSEDEIKRIIRLGGIIGLGVTRPFFQSPDHLAATIDRLSQLERGPESLAIGSDFGGVPPAFSIGLMNPTEVSVILGDLLAQRFGAGSEAKIQAVLRTNAREWLKKSLL